jgi:heat-inducible transcriptional repressor
MALSERKKRILQAIVHDYIISAEPVGSRTIARRYSLGLSPATIRNEMADLEETGYLEQPHTSAGRIPSQLGYRVYVDSLMEKVFLTKEEVMAIEKTLQEVKIQEIDKFIQQISRVISSVTNYTSLVFGPVIRKSAFKQLKVLPLEAGEGLAILITDTGFIKHKVIKLPPSLKEKELERMVAFINQRFFGLTIDTITTSLLKEVKHDLINNVGLLHETLNLIEDATRSEEGKLFLGGTTNILNQPEFRDVNKVKSLLSLFEEEELLGALLGGASPKGIEVRIGEENKLEEFKDCSLVVTTYKLVGDTIGTIGVLGPTRMEYARVIALVEHLVVRLNDI